jgi:hypothetical protein
MSTDTANANGNSTSVQGVAAQSTVQPPEGQTQGWTPTVIGTLAGVVVGVASSVGTQYWITYEGIEKPKIELENRKVDLEIRKVAIEANRQALALTPTITVTCDALNIDPWTWRVTCSAKNTGVYHADIKLQDAQVYLSTDTKEILYESGNGFSVEFPHKKQSFRALPGAVGDLWFYIKFDHDKYKSGVQRTDLIARVNFRYTTIASAQTYVLKQFPELGEMVQDAAQSGYSILVNLPQPVANP